MLGPISAVRFRFPFLLLVFALLLSLTSCGLLRKKGAAKTDDEPKSDPTVGMIEMINPEQKFVLISLRPGYLLTPGTKLYTFSPSGLKAELKVTPERKSSFLAADVLEGYPQKGQPVFATHEDVAALLQAATAAQATSDPATAPPMNPKLNWGGADPAPLPTPGTSPAPADSSGLPLLNNPYLDPAQAPAPTPVP